MNKVLAVIGISTISLLLIHGVVNAGNGKGQNGGGSSVGEVIGTVSYCGASGTNGAVIDLVGDSTMAKFYNYLLEEGHVDSKSLGKVFDSCPTLFDKVNFLSAVLLHPIGDQQREWVEAFGLAWAWTDILYRPELKDEVIRSGHEQSVTDLDGRMIN